MLTPHQCRAARAMLNWSQQELADKAGVGILTVSRFEQGKAKPYRGTRLLLRQELEKAGVRFAGENAVEFDPSRSVEP